MNQEKIGKFIAECRRQRKMTQSELGERLGVTEKSISNWENGRNMPDLSKNLLVIGKMEEICQTYLYLNHCVMNLIFP